MNLPRFVAIALLVLAGTLTTRSAGAATGPLTLTGSIDGAAYKIEVPAKWNDTLLLYSHYYMPPGASNPAVDARDPVIGAWLLAHGYALAGSAYYHGTGFAVAQAFHDQMALLDFFANRFGQPRRTIAWGQSSGGLISAGLVQQFPRLFSGALALCGPLGGAVAYWNGYLDNAFALKALLAPTSTLKLVHISNPAANLQQAEEILTVAQRTSQGRARLALAAAVADIPSWLDGSSPEPAKGDFAAQEQNQFLWEQNYDLPFTLALRAELEQRARGNPSWNRGVNYSNLLAQSVDYPEVQALYHQAGLSLEHDLTTLQHAPRIAADPGAVDYLSRNIDFTGDLRVPVLTMHTTSDGVVPVEAEQAYARMVAAAGHSNMLSQIFVDRAHHCSFTRAETLTAFQTLVHRLDTGRWGGSTSAQVLNSEATALGSDPALARIPTLPGFTDFYPTAMTTRQFAPAFVQFAPAVYLRPLDGRAALPAGQ